MSLVESPAASELPELRLRQDDGVQVLEIPASLEFDELREWLRERLPAHREALHERSLRLDLDTREIKLFDIRRLITLLRDDYRADVTGLYVRALEVQRYTERELKLRLFLSEPAPEPSPEPAPETAELEINETTEETPAPEAAETTNVEPPPLPVPEPPIDVPAPKPADVGRRTLSLQRTLRSGASVQFDGDVVLLGDVNPGAQIVAAGNVVVLGALKGMVHAGATGDEDCFILAFALRSTQLRIGRRIAIPPDKPADPRGEPEIARVTADEIVIEPYRGKFK